LAKGDGLRGDEFVLGSFPIYEVDVEQIRKDARCTAIMSLMTDEELRQRGLDEKAQREMYRKLGITAYVRCPIDDDDDQRSTEFFEASKVLHDLIYEKDHKVFLHCLAGTTRAPTLALIYLCLFMKSTKW